MKCSLANGVGSMAGYVLNICLGVSPVLIGITGSIPRHWEAVTDLAIGSTLDNLRSRFGRRKPFTAVGGVLTAVIFAMIWFAPRGWGGTACMLISILATLVIAYVSARIGNRYELETRRGESSNQEFAAGDSAEINVAKQQAILLSRLEQDSLRFHTLHGLGTAAP